MHFRKMEHLIIFNYKTYQRHLHQEGKHENAPNSQTRRKSARAVQLLQSNDSVVPGRITLLCLHHCSWYVSNIDYIQAAKHCSCVSATGMVPRSQTLQLRQCHWNGTTQRKTAAASVPLEWYHAAKHCSCVSATGMVPRSETLQLRQCHWNGTMQRNTAAASVPLEWHHAAKHCSCVSVTGMVPRSETLQCRCYARHDSASRASSVSDVIRRQLLILSRSRMGRLYRTKTNFRDFPI